MEERGAITDKPTNATDPNNRHKWSEEVIAWAKAQNAPPMTYNRLKPVNRIITDGQHHH